MLVDQSVVSFSIVVIPAKNVGDWFKVHLTCHYNLNSQIIFFWLTHFCCGCWRLWSQVSFLFSCHFSITFRMSRDRVRPSPGVFRPVGISESHHLGDCVKCCIDLFPQIFVLSKTTNGRERQYGYVSICE